MCWVHARPLRNQLSSIIILTLNAKDTLFLKILWKCYYPLQTKKTIYPIYIATKSIQIGLVSDLFLLKYTTRKSRMVIPIRKRMSCETIIGISVGLTREVILPIHRILKIFEPIIFPIARSAWRLSAAMTDVTSSGTEVQTATILAPMSTVLRQAAWAIVVAASTRVFHHT